MLLAAFPYCHTDLSQPEPGSQKYHWREEAQQAVKSQGCFRVSAQRLKFKAGSTVSLPPTVGDPKSGKQCLQPAAGWGCGEKEGGCRQPGPNHQRVG